MLSEALRLGEFAASSYWGSWFKRTESGEVCGACAIGRVCMAIGFIPVYNPKLTSTEQFEIECQDIERLFAQKWPWTVTWGDGSGDVINNPVADKISDMYEWDHASIQDIADWVATIEPKEHHDLQPESNTQLLGVSDKENVAAGGVD